METFKLDWSFAKPGATVVFRNSGRCKIINFYWMKDSLTDENSDYVEILYQGFEEPYYVHVSGRYQMGNREKTPFDIVAIEPAPDSTIYVAE